MLLLFSAHRYSVLCILMQCTVPWATRTHHLVPGSTIDVLLLGMVSIKSVTIGVHSWLPDAMEGPTSVSAVIHAATLVVAGVLWVSKLSVHL